VVVLGPVLVVFPFSLLAPTSFDSCQVNTRPFLSYHRLKDPPLAARCIQVDKAENLRGPATNAQPTYRQARFPSLRPILLYAERDRCSISALPQTPLISLTVSPTCSRSMAIECANWRHIALSSAASGTLYVWLT